MRKEKRDVVRQLFATVFLLASIFLSLGGCTQDTHTLVSVSFIKKPQTFYFTGDAFDLTDLVLCTTYSDASTEVVTFPDEDIVAMPKVGTILEKPGIVGVDVGYKGLYASLPVRVASGRIGSLLISRNPDNTEYYVGQTLSLDGLSVEITNDEGTTVKSVAWGTQAWDQLGITIGIGGKTFETGMTLDSTGSFTVTLSYKGQEATFPVFVSLVPVNALKIVEVPKRTAPYHVRDSLELMGLAVQLAYADGNSQTVAWGTDGWSEAGIRLYLDRKALTSGMVFDSAGSHTITISCNNQEVAFSVLVSVVPVNALKIIEFPKRPASYHVGDALELMGLAVQLAYADGNSQTVAWGTNGWNEAGIRIYLDRKAFASGMVFDSAGFHTITISCNNQEAAFSFTVTAVLVSDLLIVERPTKTNYHIQQMLDLTGLTVRLSYNNGKVTSVKWGSDEWRAAGLTVKLDGTLVNSQMKLSKRGVCTIVVSCNNSSVASSISVSDITSFSIVKEPTIKIYDVGESFDPTGLKVHAIYDNGDVEDFVWSAQSNAFSVSLTAGTMFKESGTKPITVTYLGKSASCNVAVHDIYAVGYQTKKGVSVAGYWKNGSFQALGNGTYASVGNCLVIDTSGNVYVGGYQNNGTVNRGGYWNSSGSFVSLQGIDSNVGNASSVYSMAFDTKGTLLLAGYADNYNDSENMVAAIWNTSKLFKTFVSSDSRLSEACVYALLTTKSGTVYAVGSRDSSSSSLVDVPYRWIIDKSSAFLDRHSSAKSAVARNLAVSSTGNLFFCGFDTGIVNTSTSNAVTTAVLWNGNGVETQLGNPNRGPSYAFGITVLGEKPFIGGHQYGVGNSKGSAGYWSQNTSGSYSFHVLGDDSRGSSYGYAMLSDDGGNIYLGGLQYLGRDVKVAGYWKNGVFHQLGDGIADSCVRFSLVHYK